MRPEVWSPEVPKEQNNTKINSQHKYEVEETLQDFHCEVQTGVFTNTRSFATVTQSTFTTIEGRRAAVLTLRY